MYFSESTSCIDSEGKLDFFFNIVNDFLLYFNQKWQKLLFTVNVDFIEKITEKKFNLWKSGVYL